jgi:hypothetical protein
LAVPVSDTPLYDATLSDHLTRTRNEAQALVAEAQTWALRQAEAAHQRADAAEREFALRTAQLAQQIEERVRATLVETAPPLRPLRVDLDEEPALEPTELDAPPIPSMEDLLRPSPGVTRFLDALLGAPER